jgi:raffinose/stachyose/melibiose transport system substrate-binding protein
MSRQQNLHVCGLVLIAAAFGFSVWTLFTRQIREADPGVRTLRFAHTMLHTGMRETFDTLAREYEAIQASQGRMVKVEQIAIPARVYGQWARTQLIGGTAPEIMLTTSNFDDELVARYLVPLAPFISQPNPYNKGTPLETMRWRDTFFDAMEIGGFNFRLAEHYGVPLTANTLRMFANRSLLRMILDEPDNAPLRERLGGTLEPRTFEDFSALCQAALRYKKRGALIPIAGSDQNSRVLLDRMFGSVTQQLLFEWSPVHDLRVATGEILDEFTRGDFHRLRHPSYQAGLRIQREVGRYFQPGFMQMQQDDALFYFTQQRAVFITASSWDAPSSRELADGRFEIAVLRIPTPSRETPGYGEYVVDQLTERGAIPEGALAMVNYHPPEQQELALDFLRFLTSQRGNQRFSELSGWLPSILGALPPPELKPFMPETRGFAIGPASHFGNQELRRVMESHLHLLVSESGGVDAYLSAVESQLPAVALHVIKRHATVARRSVAKQDVVFAAQCWLATYSPDRREQAEEKMGILLDSSHGNEFMMLQSLRPRRAMDPFR